MTLEHKHFTLDEVKFDDDTRTIKGFGSTFGNVDSHGDIVVSGAFVNSIKTRKPAMLWQHRSDQIPGVWTVAEEKSKGLYLEGVFADTPLGNEAYTLAKMGAVTGLSIGFSTKKYSIDAKKNTRSLEEVELYEVSLVTFPANEKATITTVKSLEGVPFDQLHEHKRVVEAALRDAGASDQMAAYVASLIPKPAPRDAGGEELIATLAKTTNLLKGINA